MARQISKAAYLSLAAVTDINGYYLVEAPSGALKGYTCVYNKLVCFLAHRFFEE